MWWCGGRVPLKPDGTWWCTGGEVKGKLANGVCSRYSHTTSERGLSSFTNADAHTTTASSRLNWRPRRFKWTRSFRRKTKSGFCACAITFQTHYTPNPLCLHGMLRDDLCLVFQPIEIVHLQNLFVFCCNVWQCEKSSAMKHFVRVWIVPLRFKDLGTIILWFKQSRKIVSSWRREHCDPFKRRDLWKATSDHHASQSVRMSVLPLHILCFT